MQKLLVILDLDETLVFGTERPLCRPHDFSCGPFSVYRRPGVGDFLAGLRDDFLIAVWTSAGLQYANCVVGNLFPEGFPLEFFWSAERCTQRLNEKTRESYFRKDLRKVKRKRFDLKRVVAVDDSPEKYGSSYGNLVRVREYRGESEDIELSALLKYLRKIRDEPDVRRIEKRNWRATVRL
jgi:TFIIF-interacting CTD phosphatase-like protein